MITTNQDTTPITVSPTTPVGPMPPPAGETGETAVATNVTPGAPTDSDAFRNQYNRRTFPDLNRTARSTPAQDMSRLGINRASTSTEVADPVDDAYLIRNYQQLSDGLRRVRELGFVGDVNRTLFFDNDVDEEWEVETPDGRPIPNAHIRRRVSRNNPAIEPRAPIAAIVTTVTSVSTTIATNHQANPLGSVRPPDLSTLGPTPRYPSTLQGFTSGYFPSSPGYFQMPSGYFPPPLGYTQGSMNHPILPSNNANHFTATQLSQNASQTPLAPPQLATRPPEGQTSATPVAIPPPVNNPAPDQFNIHHYPYYPPWFPPYGPYPWGPPQHNYAGLPGNNLNQGIPSLGDGLDSSPLVDWIQQYPLPPNMKCPSVLGTYEGKDDPDDFLQAFRGVAEMQAWSDPVACRAFSWVLKGDAREWYNALPRRSIVGFSDLKAKFRAQFYQQKKHRKTHVSVHNIKQREGEGTRSFISRYTNETQEIAELPESQRVSGLIHGLRTIALIEHLSVDLPKTYNDLKNKALIWLDLKETAANSIRAPIQDGDLSSGKRKHQNMGGKDGRQRHPFNRDEGTRNLAPLAELTKSPRQILATERAARTFTQPPKMQSRGKRDFNLYCEFHADHGHDTNDCIQLKKAIDEAVKTGKLAHLVVGVRQNAKVKEETPNEAIAKDTPEATIYMLHKDEEASEPSEEHISLGTTTVEGIFP